jgi:hypothetical protein
MSGPRAPHSLRHKPQSTPLKFEEIQAPLLPIGTDGRPARRQVNRHGTPVEPSEPATDLPLLGPPPWCSGIAVAAFTGVRLETLYMTAGLGPEPPFTHTPRLHEHDASAQAAIGTFD